MIVFEFMARSLTHARMKTPNIGQLVCRTFNGVPRWLKPKTPRQPKTKAVTP